MVVDADADPGRDDSSLMGTVPATKLKLTEDVILPPGSFGAGGWAPGNQFSGKYPRLSPAECIEARASFRDLLILKYHSVIRAWRDIDKNGDGTLSLFEFMRACQKLGVNQAPRQLWEALDVDRSGSISLNEVDQTLAELLGSLAVAIWASYGSVEKAWRQCFNRRSSIRIGPEEFEQACDQIGFNGDSRSAFQELRADKATTGISRQEFGFLELWFKDDTRQGPLHDHLEKENHLTHLRNTAPKPEKKRPFGAAKADFKTLLRKSYGNMIRAWREGLDRDHNGVLDWKELQAACADCGYPGNRKELWGELDVNGSGAVSLAELDEPTSHMIHELVKCAQYLHGSWEEAWHTVIDKTGHDRVPRQRFVEGCRVLTYGGNADRLFELLDMDRCNYLSFANTQWIEGTEVVDNGPEPEVIGGVRITSNYKKATKSQARNLDFKARDNRMQKARFVARDRGEIPGSSPTAARHSPLARSGSFAMTSASTFGMDMGSEGNAHQQTSASWSSTSPKISKTRMEPRDDDPVFPDWLVAVESRAASPLLKSMSSSQMSQSKKTSLRRPLSPQSPGKGGWPGSRSRVVDPLWGGASTSTSVKSNPTEMRTASVNSSSPKRQPLDAGLPLVASPLSRSPVSEPCLARWRAGLSAG